MPVDRSFSQLLAVMSQVERYALSGGLVIARPKDPVRLVFDHGVLLHAEMTRTRGRVTKGPTVLDELIGRHQGTLEWEWPGEREEAPIPSVTRKDTSIFRRSLKMLVRYGYFVDPQSSPVAAEFFGVPEEALSNTTAHDETKAQSDILAQPKEDGIAVPPTAALESATPATDEAESDNAEEETTPTSGKAKDKAKTKSNSASRSVIANPQTALGKIIFNKALLTEVPLPKLSRGAANAKDENAIVEEEG